MKSRNDAWGELFDWKDEEEFEATLELEPESGEGVVFLEEAHEALLRLEQRTNKRGGMMKQPRRAESWQ